jgi:hypothetical protein
VITRNDSAVMSVALAFLALTPVYAAAHCDGLDGPVVRAAERALETRNPALVLIWVQPKDESEIQTAFARTLAVRVLSVQARELADRFFFETVVRLHRTGEGASYTGLKPAGRDLGPAIPAADETLRLGSVEPLLQLLSGVLERGVREQFAEATKTMPFKPDDLAAGRAHVKAYVEFIHFVERLYENATSAPHGHFEERDLTPHGSVTPGRQK